MGLGAGVKRCTSPAATVRVLVAARGWRGLGPEGGARGKAPDACVEVREEGGYHRVQAWGGSANVPAAAK
jgi:hypothetical protein